MFGLSHGKLPNFMISIAVMLVLVCLLSPPLHAQPPAPAPQQSSRYFNIGFLPEGSDFENGELLMEELQRELKNVKNQRLLNAMVRAGYTDIRLSPCDGQRDMVQRMAQGEFELVFATALVFARQTGPYAEPILQTFRPGDFKLPSADGVLRRGVVFVGPTCPLFKTNEITSEAKRGLLAHSLMAVPSADSIAGYVYPRLYMSQYLNLAEPGGFLFCGSDAEVVKHVVSGLAPLGACRKGALELLLPADKPEQYFKVLFETLPFPTDPILLHNNLFPSRSDLGRELRLVIKTFFNSTQKVDPKLTVEDASRAEYENLEQALKLFDEPGPAGPQPAPPPPSPAEDQPSTAVLPALDAPAAGPEDSLPPAPVETPQVAPDLTPALPDDFLSRGPQPGEGRSAG